MQSDIQILPLSTHRRDVRRFLQVSHAIYRHDPHWVAPLQIDLQQVLSPRNPLFQHTRLQLWVASQNGTDVGRIAGLVDNLYHQHQHPDTACFGFFESLPDPLISQRLFDTLFTWTRQQGLGRLLGPMNPSSNDECGLLVHGFDSPPVFMMPYNPAYYADLFLAAGFRKAKDLIAFDIDVSQSPHQRLDRALQRFQERNPDIHIRPIRRKSLKQDLEKIRAVYNQAWQRNWGFVPLTNPEVDFLADRLRHLLVEGLVWLAENEHQPVGFLLAVPDFNHAIKPLRGRLLSPRLPLVLPYLLHWKVPKRARVIVLGVVEQFRARGVESVMLAHAIQAGWNIGIRSCEASWVLEDNLRSRRVIEMFGGKPYKTYRLYERSLDTPPRPG